MREVQAIIFDLDNTLWDVGPVILRAEHAMARFLAERYPRVMQRHTLESMRDVRARMAIEHPAMRHDFTWLRTRALLEHAREARTTRRPGPEHASLDDGRHYLGAERPERPADPR